MLESTYAQYLGQVHASSAVVRSTFILMGTFNIVGKLVTGNFMDKRESAPITFSLVGNAFMLLPFMSLGKIHIQCRTEGVPMLNTERELCGGGREGSKIPKNLWMYLMDGPKGRKH